MPLQRGVRKVLLHPSGSKEPGDLQYWLNQLLQARIVILAQGDYIPYEAEVVVFAIAHLSRTPEYWLGRINKEGS